MQDNILDSGTNFINARNELHELNMLLKSKEYNTKLLDTLEECNIE